MHELVTINGYSFYPSDYEVQISDIDKEEGSGRNQNGDMLRDRAGIKKKVLIKCVGVPQSISEPLLKAVKPQFVTVTYLDPELGWRTMTAYSGDKSCKVFKYDNKKKTWIWEEISFNLVEK